MPWSATHSPGIAGETQITSLRASPAADDPDTLRFDRMPDLTARPRCVTTSINPENRFCRCDRRRQTLRAIRALGHSQRSVATNEPDWPLQRHDILPPAPD